MKAKTRKLATYIVTFYSTPDKPIRDVVVAAASDIEAKAMAEKKLHGKKPRFCRALNMDSVFPMPAVSKEESQAIAIASRACTCRLCGSERSITGLRQVLTRLGDELWTLNQTLTPIIAANMTLLRWKRRRLGIPGKS
jgi:hypothetical protein